MGNGHGINIGINLATSKYVLYLDVDTILDKNLIKNLVACANEIEDFAVIGPNLKNYNYKNTDFLKIEEFEKKYCKMKFIEGAIMLFNKNIILENKISFDEKIFLYWEERDFLHQCLKKKQKIYLIKNLFAFHQGGSSIAKLDFPDIELNRNWHYMWSKFYFYKKNYSILSGYKNTLRQFFSSFFKMIFFTILNNNKKKIYYERFSGLINSYAGRKSWRRPIL